MAENALVQSSNIQKFNISSNQQNKAADLTGGVVDFRYYESVLSNNVTASTTKQGSRPYRWCCRF